MPTNGSLLRKIEASYVFRRKNTYHNCPDFNSNDLAHIVTDNESFE